MSTEVGFLKLQDICTKVCSGGTPSTLNKEFYMNGVIPWVKTKEVNNNKIYESETYITEEALAKSSAKLIPENSVIVAMYGNGDTAGRVAINKIPVATNQACCNLVIDPERADYRFVYYYLRTQYQKLVDLKNGGAQQNLNAGILKEYPFPNFPLVKQVEIADVLEVLDDKIALNRQANQTLEAIAQAIFKSWFVDFDPVRAKNTALENGEDPERAAMAAISCKGVDALDELPEETLAQLKTTAALFPDKLVESELGEVPAGWEIKSLYETAEYVNGAAFKNEDFSSDKSGLPIVKIAELKYGISAQTKFSTNQYAEKYRINSGDIFYSWSGSPETSLDVFKWFGGEGWINQHIFKLNFTCEQQKYFAYYLLKEMRPILVQTAMDKQTTGLGHVTVADMKRMKVAYPDQSVLDEFSRIISALFEKGSELEIESQVLVSIRDSLLPKLLSGEISVETTQVELEELL